MAVVAPAPPPSPEEALLRAWTDPAESLEERVARARRAALESGTWSFDPAARAVLGARYLGVELEVSQGLLSSASAKRRLEVALAETLTHA